MQYNLIVLNVSQTEIINVNIMEKGLTNEYLSTKHKSSLIPIYKERSGTGRRGHVKIRLILLAIIQ